mgnify:CR=1 FL=1
MDPVTGYCYGCGRNNDEKKIWKDQNTSDEWKKQNLEDIQKRMQGWQLESFKESYEHKKNNGMSLFKKNQLNEVAMHMARHTLLHLDLDVLLKISQQFFVKYLLLQDLIDTLFFRLLPFLARLVIEESE